MIPLCKEIFVFKAFEKSMQIYCTITIFILICIKKKKKKKKKKKNPIASIFITLTEINNEAHYVAKKNPKEKKTKKTQARTAPIGFALSV